MTDQEREDQEERRSDAKAWANQSDAKYASTAIKLPPGFTNLKLKTPRMLINILEYRVILGNPPLIHRGRGPKSECDEGYLHYELTYEVHRVPTPDNFGALYCCRWWNWQEPCPICDWTREHGGAVDPELLKGMKPQMRHLWNVIDLDSKDQKVQVFDTNHFNRGSGFGEQIKKAIQAVARYADFARYDKLGYDLALTVDDQIMPGRKFQAATRIDFLPRDKGWNKSILKECCQLEDCLIHYEYDELKAMFLQQSPGRTNTTTTPPPPRQEDPRRDDPRRDDPRRDDRRDEPRGRREEPPAQEESRRREPDPAPRQEESRRREEPPPPRQEEPRRDAPPATNGKAEPTAVEYGVKLHDFVTVPKQPAWGKCEVVRISGDGTSLTIEEVVDGIEHRAISPAEVKLELAKGSDAPPPPTQQTPAAPPPPAQEPPRQEERPRSRRDDDDFDRPRREEPAAAGTRRRD